MELAMKISATLVVSLIPLGVLWGYAEEQDKPWRHVALIAVIACVLGVLSCLIWAMWCT